MLKFDFSHYVNQSYLLTEAVFQAQQSFKSSDINLLTLSDFLSPKLAQNCSIFLSRDAAYANTHGIYSSKTHTVDEARWRITKEEDRFFFYQMLDRACNKSVPLNSLSFLKLRKFLRSDLFRSYIASITGMNLVSSSAMLVHKMNTGHFLKKHNDKSHDRKIAFILYMSPDWSPEYGGKLNIVDHKGFEISIDPHYNSLILFDVTKHDYHYISEVYESTEPCINARNGRISINGWFG